MGHKKESSGNQKIFKKCWRMCGWEAGTRTRYAVTLETPGLSPSKHQCGLGERRSGEGRTVRAPSAGVLSAPVRSKNSISTSKIVLSIVINGFWTGHQRRFTG